MLKQLVAAPLELPFRDFNTFRKYWNRNGAYGSWQARRDILDQYFEPLHKFLGEREAKLLTSTLVSAISPRQVTGWPRVDEEISTSAATPRTA
ncbi:hypothetical protein HQ346_19705 [Rhodococcus sp. BP-252]|uniref:hypothetical protein n=1 Tax=unclassified Rhodococcus (in: high G+C Gram-positive bacteria) TaxID=192944 RepID=UPI001C9AFF5C|nr:MULTISPECIES: hypothetical protein [unclassified Rhodococcus (in: high G+C Gram-positive bacteria)]MBY6413924.1 hypothetical protein [Rhodococcus sp. BP-320]MBY6418626.1 hypothetical protein [Rhodococcus sp. BP-321]MBY6422921.1 hypothetical protein [Rhodococcus sp. BP-324]MBY6428730.1 hypothetical protein [Rhodococcus sp. BP-323]MBY6433747.1 hypothetical protein [Rhodococcus sp. BP-322]